jgi:ABC-type proline/glycine betaine transport system permease subunit
VPPRRALDRVAAAFVLVVLAFGSLALWIGVPLAMFWLISQVTHTSSGHFVNALISIPVAMALFAWALFWLNRLYLRIRAAAAPPEWDTDEGQPRLMRGPLEPLLVISFAIALVAMIVWFFFFAENPLLW